MNKNSKSLKKNKRGATFISMRIVMSIVLAAVIMSLAIVGSQYVIRVLAEKQVERECNDLIASLSTMIASGDARDVNNLLDEQGDSRTIELNLPERLVYIGFGTDPDPDNDGKIENQMISDGACIVYKIEGMNKKIIWLDNENIKFREGTLTSNGRWVFNTPLQGFIIKGGGKIKLTFEIVKNFSGEYVLIHANDIYICPPPSASFEIYETHDIINADFDISTGYGTTQTIFRFNAGYSTDEMDDPEELECRWDFEGDGNWDTQWSKEKIVEHQYFKPGTYKVILEVKNKADRIAYTEKTVHVRITDTDLAYHWAPIIYQDVHEADPDADYITNFDFDGDWDGDNNWENQPNYPMKAYVYYWIVETETHYFIGYALYHPRDWYVDLFGNICNKHENDMEGVLMVIKKDDTPYGQFLLLITTIHLDFFSFTDKDSYPSNSIKDGQETIDGDVEFEEWNGETHPIICVDAGPPFPPDLLNGYLGGHAVHGDFIWQKGFPGGNGVIYYPKGIAEEPEDQYDNDVGYALRDIKELWNRRYDYKRTFEGWGTFKSNDVGNLYELINLLKEANIPWADKFGLKAHAPWVWDDWNDFKIDLGDNLIEPQLVEIYPGDIFFDPVRLILFYHNGFEYVSRKYVYTSFKDLKDVVEIIKKQKPLLYTTYYTNGSKEKYERVFSKDDDIKFNAVIMNPTSSYIKGKITLQIWDEFENKLVDKKDFEIEIPIGGSDNISWKWKPQDYEWESCGFHFVGKKFTLRLVVDNALIRKYGFFVDEFGIPEWQRNVRSVMIGEILKEEVMPNDQHGLDMIRFKRILDEVKHYGFNMINIGAEYYSYGEYENKETPFIDPNIYTLKELIIGHWFPTVPPNYKYEGHYTTPPVSLIEFCNGDIEKAREKIKELVERAHQEKIKVQAYTDVMGIYAPNELGERLDDTDSPHLKWNSEGWVAKNKDGTIKRLTWQESYLAGDNIENLAVRPCYVGNAKNGEDARNDDAFSPEKIKEEIVDKNEENAWKEDPSYLYHIVKQYRYLKDFYDFDCIFTDDIGRLIMKWQFPDVEPTNPLQWFFHLTGPGEPTETDTVPFDAAIASLIIEKMERIFGPLSSNIIDDFGPLNGIDYSETAKKLRGSYDKDEFEKASLANMLKYLRRQIKYNNPVGSFHIQTYFGPALLSKGWNSVLTAYDMDGNDQYFIHTPFFAKWAILSHELSYKPLRTDYRRSIDGAFPLIANDRIRASIVGISFANHVHGEPDLGLVRENKITGNCFKMMANLTKSNKSYSNIFKDWEIQELLYHSGLPDEEELKEYKKSDEIKLLAGSGPYYVLYRIPCEYGEKARILHVINQNNFIIPSPPPFPQLLGNYVFEIKIPIGEKVENVWEVSPHYEDDNYAHKLTEGKDYTIEQKVDGDYIRISVKSVETYKIIYVELSP